LNIREYLDFGWIQELGELLASLLVMGLRVIFVKNMAENPLE
jgi:hypothetical protein